MKLSIFCALLVTAIAAHAGDYQAAALEILTGEPISAANCFTDSNGDRVRDGVIGSVVTMAEVNAITNRADVLALAAAQDVSDNVPTTFRTGVAVPIPDADGHYMLLQPSGDGQPVVAIQISDSPIDPATWRARRDATLARLAAERASRSEAYATNKAKAVQTAQGAQNVPQLRAALADMQAQIDALRAIVEAGR